MDLDDLDRRLSDIYSSHRWIVVNAVAAGATDIVEQLRTWGADVIAVVASFAGIGDQPQGLPVLLTESKGDTLMNGFRLFESVVADPPQHVLETLDGLDPHRAAKVYAATFSTDSSVLHRTSYGARRPEWLALEDKMIIDGLWDDLGIDRAPSAIVDVEDAPDAAAELAGPLGTVWVADNREGWHGGGEYLRWVRTGADTAPALEWFSAHAGRVRVMPFLDGVPCSIHGFVAADDVGALRPVEMVMLRSTDESRIVYAGPSTLWDPPAHHRQAMRRVAVVVADHMRREFGYRGPFSIDGIMTADGFRPTEMNPRISVGSTIQAMSAGFPIGSVTRAMIAGDIDVSAGWATSEIVAAADRTRWCRVHVGVPGDPDVRAGSLCFEQGSPRWCGEARADITCKLGHGPGGAVLQLRVDTARVRSGPATGPLIAAAVAFLADEWALHLPPLEPAPDLAAGRAPGTLG